MMHPYRHAGVDTETELDRQEIAAFGLLHRAARLRSLATGLSLSGLTVLAAFVWGYWFYFGQHCGFACM